MYKRQHLYKEESRSLLIKDLSLSLSLTSLYRGERHTLLKEENESPSSVMDNIAPIDAKMREQHRAKDLELQARRREEIELHQKRQIEAGKARRAREEETIAEARVTAGELRSPCKSRPLA